jgi:hypothetical protein
VVPHPELPLTSSVRLPVRKLLLFVCLSLGDLGLTWHLLSNGKGQVYEGNPLARCRERITGSGQAIW